MLSKKRKKNKEYVIYSDSCGRKNVEHVIINNEKIFVGDKVWREEIGNMRVFILQDCGNTIKMILKLEDDATPTSIGKKFLHPLCTDISQDNLPGLYHEIRVPYKDKKLENLVIGRFYKIKEDRKNMLKKIYPEADIFLTEVMNYFQGEDYHSKCRIEEKNKGCNNNCPRCIARFMIHCYADGLSYRKTSFLNSEDQYYEDFLRMSKYYEFIDRFSPDFQEEYYNILEKEFPSQITYYEINNSEEF